MQYDLSELKKCDFIENIFIKNKNKKNKNVLFH